MATKYLNDVGLKYFYERLKTVFADKNAFDTLYNQVQGIVSEGGEPNLINTISVNGTNVPPDNNKNVALTVPTATSDLTNDGDGTSNFATEAYVTQNGGKIDTISVNITVPTAMSQLTNDGNYVTDSAYVHTDTNYAAADKSKVDKLVFNGTKIDESILPSYVDDVVEVYPVGATELASNWFALTAGGAPITPESGKIYVLMADSTNYTANSQFRYGGSTYVKLSDGGVSAITTAEIDVIMTPSQGS